MCMCPRYTVMLGPGQTDKPGQLLLLTHALFHWVIQEASRRYQLYQAPGNKDERGRKALSSEIFHYSRRVRESDISAAGTTTRGIVQRLKGFSWLTGSEIHIMAARKQKRKRRRGRGEGDQASTFTLELSFSPHHHHFCLFYFMFETGFHFVALAGLEPTEIHLHAAAGTKDVCHHTWLPLPFS